MSEQKISELKSKLSYGTTEYFEARLREMVNSIYCYNGEITNYDTYLNNKYITDYYTDIKYNNGNARLTKENSENIVGKQVD